MMRNLPIIDGPRLEPLTADSLMILLHGYGSNGDDLFSLSPLLSEHFPNTVMISPNAPFDSELSPFGYQWFSLADRSLAAMSQGAKISAPILDKFIDDLIKDYDIRNERVILFGFSQGTMMALHVALRRKNSISSVLGFSGSFLDSDTIETEITSKVPIYLSHGDQDEIVPVSSIDHASSVLKKFGIVVETNIESGLGHSIGNIGLERGIKFALENLKK